MTTMTTNNPEYKAEIYDVIRAGFKNKLSQSDIAKELNKKNLETPRGKSFTQTTVSSLERRIGCSRARKKMRAKYTRAKKPQVVTSDSSYKLIVMLKDVLSAGHEASTEKALLLFIAKEFVRSSE